MAYPPSVLGGVSLVHTCARRRRHLQSESVCTQCELALQEQICAFCGRGSRALCPALFFWWSGTNISTPTTRKSALLRKSPPAFCGLADQDRIVGIRTGINVALFCLRVPTAPAGRSGARPPCAGRLRGDCKVCTLLAFDTRRGHTHTVTEYCTSTRVYGKASPLATLGGVRGAVDEEGMESFRAGASALKPSQNQPGTPTPQSTRQVEARDPD